ncbi:MAG TPA: PD-(D/E)XK nuclease family protein, partial [Acidimicrobiales bacterium]|nr:PD-(D/E)XK nuclease family protein [Acidimicrobiales bacterium]
VLTPAARIAGRTLLGLLALPERHFRREDVFAWLAGAVIRHGARRAPVTAWERISREAGVVGGADQWDRLLGHYAEEADREAEQAEADPDAPVWKAEQLRRNADQARSLREFVLGWVGELAAADVPRPWSGRARWARGLLHRLLGPERARLQWPDVEQKAADRVERALDRLGCLDEIEARAGLDVFVRTLQLELDADLGRVGRMGEGVLVGSITMGVGQDLDLLLVLGLVEGSFPSPVHEDSLLPDNERAATGDELSRRGEMTERQHRQLLASLAAASAQVLCLPRGDLRRSAERVPSRWALDVASWLAGTRLWSEDLLLHRAPWLSHSPSYDAGIRSLTEPATDQEYRLRALMATDGDPTTNPAVDDAVLTAGVSMITGRRSDALTRFDGNLGGMPVPSPVNRTVSATALEGWAVCPFAYFAQRVLGVEQVERPEDRLRISPLDWGSLVHEVLERFVAEVLERPPSCGRGQRRAGAPQTPLPCEASPRRCATSTRTVDSSAGRCSGARTNDNWTRC